LNREPPVVVNCKHDSYDIYIGRPGDWGNPFTHEIKETLAKYVVSSREEAIAAYRNYICSNEALMNRLEELSGKRLGCWCHPQKCHGDVLVELWKHKFGSNLDQFFE
jgi:hypothetical protein